MKIWKLSSDVDNYDWVEPIPYPDLDYIQSFDGRKKAERWKISKFQRVYPEESLTLGDNPNCFVPVFSKKAVDVLIPLIKDDSELLPIDFNEGTFFIINVITVLNVINYDKSDFIRFESSGRIMMFNKYVFNKSDELLGHHIFKIKDEAINYPFVSDKFKSFVERNGLEGFIFELVWDSEN